MFSLFSVTALTLLSPVLARLRVVFLAYTVRILLILLVPDGLAVIVWPFLFFHHILMLVFLVLIHFMHVYFSWIETNKKVRCYCKFLLMLIQFSVSDDSTCNFRCGSERISEANGSLLASSSTLYLPTSHSVLGPISVN